MDGVGRSLGEGLEFVALVATLIAVSATLLAWSLLLHFGRRRDGLRGVGLALVVAIHFLPILVTVADPSSNESWSLSDQWRGWGAAAAWSLPGLAALIRFVPSLVARAAIITAYGAVIAMMIYLYQPGLIPDLRAGSARDRASE